MIASPRVLIVDDHDLFRDGIVSLLRSRGYDVVGEAGNGREAVERVRDLNPDLVLMDIQMPDMGGLQATRLIKAEHPDVKVVILTVSEEEDDLFNAIKSGARGYLLKKLKSDAFFDLISGVMEGEAPISPRMASKLLNEFSRKNAAGTTSTARHDLSNRESEVLRLIAQGKTNGQIASDLVISESTVKYHLRNILDKLQLENRAQVTAYAARRGF